MATRIMRWAAFALLLAIPALAQDAPPRRFVIHVTEAELAIIGRALEERPYREVAALLLKLQNQIASQAAPPPASEQK
jgi:hypothetical protein